jgi:hypothetical protein
MFTKKAFFSRSQYEDELKKGLNSMMDRVAKRPASEYPIDWDTDEKTISAFEQGVYEGAKIAAKALLESMPDSKKSVVEERVLLGMTGRVTQPAPKKLTEKSE